MSASTAEIKREFMAYRNGVVGDALRAGGMSCYDVIFGLNLPQLKHIAMRYANADDEVKGALARELWQDARVRESRLLALHLYGMMTAVDVDEVRRLMADVLTREEAEVMCLRLLRNHPEAENLLAETGVDTPLQRHLHDMLDKHLHQ